MQLAAKRWNATGSERGKIVMLHGMGGTGALWRPIAASLEDHYSILAPDQRGHGGSRVMSVPGGRTPNGYTPLDYGRDLVETLQRESFRPAWVVGHSMGVRSACALAHLDPDAVKGLVLVDLGFSGFAGGGLGEGLAAFLRKLPQRFPNRDLAREFMAAECPDTSIAQYLMAVSVRLPSGELEFPFDHAALIATIEAARDAPTRTWVRGLGSRGMPILVLRGERSLVWSAEELETERAAFTDLPSVAFETIEGTGHGLPFEKRREFVARLRTFMGD